MNLLVVLDAKFLPSAQYWVERFGFTLAHQLPSQPQFFLCLDAQGLSLKQGDNPRVSVQVDFSQGANAHRRKFGGGTGQDIAKAMGLGSGYKPSVLDATAGLGRDTFVLASLGCAVTALERNPVVAALLSDGLERARHDPEVADIIARIRLLHGTSHELLPVLAQQQQPDIVYLDPMFEQDGRQTALVKKDMQAFHTVVGNDSDTDALLEQALASARCRVVVKRARKAAPLAQRPPTYSLVGKANRFDIYVRAKVAPVALT